MASVVVLESSRPCYFNQILCHFTHSLVNFVTLWKKKEAAITVYIFVYNIIRVDLKALFPLLL